MDESKLLSVVRTVTEARRLALGLGEVEREAKGGDDLTESLKTVFDAETARMLMDLKGAFSGSGSDFVAQLLRAVERWPVLRLRLAIRPTERLIEAVSGYLRVAGLKRVLVDFIYDPGVLGGVEIEWQGLWRDYSWRKKFDLVVTAEWLTAQLGGGYENV